MKIPAGSPRPRRLPPGVAFAVLIAGLAALTPARPALAQPVLALREELDFDRPESWALKLFSALAQPSALGGPSELAPGQVELGLEAGSVPHLSETARRVGFYGTKVEEINRSPVLARPRLSVGLPGRLALTVAYVPPVELDGVKPNLFAAALTWRFLDSRHGSLALRLFGQGGKIEGDITCSRQDVAAGDDPVANPFLCEEPSRDEVTIRGWGAALDGALPAFHQGRLRPFLSLGASRIEPRFQVDARYAGLHDRTLQTTSGTVLSASAGATYQASERTRLHAEVFYAPLSIVPREDLSKRQRDLYNLRLMLSYRLR